MVVTKPEPISVVHVISGLEAGGAQTVLLRLLSDHNRDLFRSHVISLTSHGVLGPRIKGLGVPVSSIGMQRGRVDLFRTRLLLQRLLELGPSVVQTWMYHSNLVGGMLAKLMRDVRVVWGLHHTELDPKQDKRLTIWTANIGAWLSSFVPDRIVCCSQATEDYHQRIGYSRNKMLVIQNGFDVDEFVPDPAARSSIRYELNLPADTLLIGIAGRFHPQKDHRNFIRAVKIVSDQRPDIHFIMCGDDVNTNNDQLRNWIKDADLGEKIHLLGFREDMPRIFAALDVSTTSSSHGEGLPNVIGEAMASGIPCVVTNVGDSAQIVAKTGIVVPPKRPEDLANGWLRLLRLNRSERLKLGQEARNRIVSDYSLVLMVARYEEVYNSLVEEMRLNKH